MSMARLFLPPALVKAFLTRSTSTATSAGSGLTASVPDSMRATSSCKPVEACDNLLSFHSSPRTRAV